MILRPRPSRAVAALSAATLLLAGCGGSSTDTQQESGPQVAASFYPLQFVAQRVAGRHVDVQALTEPGVEPHDLELSIEQTAQIAEAELVLYERGFQPAVDEAVAQNAPDRDMDVLQVLRQTSSNGVRQPSSNGGPEPRLRLGDPHVWLDPLLLRDIATAFTKRLSVVDPQHASAYAANLDALEEDLVQLDREYVRGLASCARNTVVVSHDAFSYWQRYGLRFESISGQSPDAEPSPARIGALHNLVAREQLTHVFTEPLVDSEPATTLADDLGLQVAPLDPIEGLSEDSAGQDYLSLMRDNLRQLRVANQCQ